MMSRKIYLEIIAIVIILLGLIAFLNYGLDSGLPYLSAEQSEWSIILLFAGLIIVLASRVLD